jgi:hypothetical protein
MNVVYADKEDNIYYAGLGKFPERNPELDYDVTIPGISSEVLWEPKFKPLDSLAQVHNPGCGYVCSMNHTPFEATCDGENPNRNKVNSTFTFYNHISIPLFQYINYICDIRIFIWIKVKHILHILNHIKVHRLCKLHI